MVSEDTGRSGLSGAWTALPGVGRAALIVSLLGFVVRISSESSRVSNGVVVECDYTDFGALALGAAALVTGVLTVLAGREHHRRGLVIGIGVVAILLGGLHVARGLGAFHDCEGGSSTATGAVEFGPDDVQDRFEDQLDTTTTAPTPPDPGAVGSWQAVIGLASSHRDEVLSLDLPEGWTVTSDGSGTVTRQQLPEAVSADGSVELTGHARAVTPEERAELVAELEAEGWMPTTIGGWEVWTAIDRGNSVVDDHRYTLVADDLYAALTFGADPDAEQDPTAERALR
ncbi:MAG: hypothetical protein AAGK32_08320, partial [Actinomycetota bacterium]